MFGISATNRYIRPINILNAAPAYHQAAAPHVEHRLSANNKKEVIMEIRIQSIHFNATEKLQAFIEKKVGKLAKSCDSATTAEVILKVVKPETAMNKEVAIRIDVPGANKLHAEKVCDTFEEGVDLCVEALQRQAEKYKEKQRAK